MAKRKSTGTRLRFQVFHRDGFTCQYCGQHPPEVILQVDHIVSVSKGGTDEIENLTTACVKCNAGKTNSDLSKVTPRLSKNSEEMTEKYEQLLEFYNYQKKFTDLKKLQIRDLQEYWQELHPRGRGLSNENVSSLKSFLKNFSVNEIQEAMDLSQRIGWEKDCFRYMCGILHNKLQEKREHEEWEILKNLDISFAEVDTEALFKSSRKKK